MIKEIIVWIFLLLFLFQIRANPSTSYSKQEANKIKIDISGLKKESYNKELGRVYILEKQGEIISRPVLLICISGIYNNI